MFTQENKLYLIVLQHPASHLPISHTHTHTHHLASIPLISFACLHKIRALGCHQSAKSAEKLAMESLSGRRSDMNQVELFTECLQRGKKTEERKSIPIIKEK